MKLLLCILDGVGIRKEYHGNAVYQANMPNFNKLLNQYPNCLLEASGQEVGLPAGQMGNSEVGHTNIGAGRIVYQPLELINSKIENKEFFNNEKILNVINYTKENNTKLHIMGLLSDGGIHSHINHLFALLDMCKMQGIDQVYLHMFLDGRDTLPTEGIKYLDELNAKINEIGIGKICTISGRYYAMDRDNNYDRLEKAYEAIVYGIGEKYDSYEEAIKANLDRNITDEFTIPCVIEEGRVEPKDGVIIFNFRPDRLREIGESLTNPSFDKFPHENLNVKLVTMMPVSESVINDTAYDIPKLDNTFGEYISKMGLTQFRIAETEKYAHVTYFFDGGVERKLNGARRKIIPSPKVATYDLKPEMSAYKITSCLLKQMHKYDVVVLNFANGDMVGHTGNLQATIKALEVIDNCIGKLYDKVVELGGIMAITADHGNSDYMLDDNDNIITSHSVSKVPLIITKEGINLHDGKLGDIAPTLLTLLGLPIPSEMTGDDLTKPLKKKKTKKKKDKKKKEKKERKISLFEKIFRIISFIFIIGSVTFYIGRLSYFYIITHHVPKYKEVNIIEKLDTYLLEDCNNGKCFKGNVDNNYLYLKGIMWRIISYNENSIKLISDEALTTLKYNNVDEWLNNFKNMLSIDEYIKNISLLTKEEYDDVKLDQSYLDSKSYWWIQDSYITKDLEFKDIDENYYGVKPVIELSSDAIIVSGTGFINDPYMIQKENPYYLIDANIGGYIEFSNNIWRIVGKDENGVKIAYSNLLDEHIYSNQNQLYNVDDPQSLANYLNNDFYNSLEDKDKIVNATWKINKYSPSNGFNYNEVINTFTANVALLNIGDLFLNDQYNYALLTETDNNMTYKVNPYNLLFLDFKESARKVRPVIYLKGDVVLTGGTGLVNNPYQVGEENEEKYDIVDNN